MQINPQQPNNPPPTGGTGPTPPTHKTPPKKDFKEALKRHEGKKSPKDDAEIQAQKQAQEASRQAEAQEKAATNKAAEEKTAAEKGKEKPAPPPNLLSALASSEKQQLSKLSKEELAKQEKVEGMETKKGEEKGKTKKEGASTTGTGTGAQEATLAQGIPGQQSTQLGVGVTAGTAENKPTSSVEKIIDVFEKNRLFESGVTQVQVIPRGAETQVSVTLSSGVKVDVNVAAGGHDLNIHITGLNATVQAAIDNPQNQEKLRQLLVEKGFTVHQIVTERAEQAPISASSRDQPSQQGRDDRGGGGGGGRGGEQQGGQQQPRR
jgi:hypothetical protein